MKTALSCVAVLLLAGSGVRAEKQTVDAGQQKISARRTTRPVVIDGAFSPAEWSAAIPTHVNAVKPDLAPGLVPRGLSVSDNQDDSSFTIYAMYDDNNLYIAVDVADDRVISDNPVLPFLDDDAEIFIDGDNQPTDMDAISFVPDWFGVLPNNEGFQLVHSVGDNRAAYPAPFVQVDWDSKAGLRPRGYLIEFRISLDSINTKDNSWFTNPAMMPPDGNDPTQPFVPGSVFSPVFRRPGPGDSIGLNVTVADDDCGRDPEDPNPWADSWARAISPNPSSYTAWDGSSASWYYADEAAWGTLYFVP